MLDVVVRNVWTRADRGEEFAQKRIGEGSWKTVISETVHLWTIRNAG